ncbi:DMT family transporter [Alicyclobacillus acidiphilus]|uniref:DMT family transporter n=1 Tax=Alicyclobacillus acidiphilus TaxID=182455 RepID=UPI0009F9D873|nr:DMT family transporter [Alicyclobacillus acidiphilus]
MPKWFLFVLLILANLIWSGSFPATSVASQSIAPTLLVMCRLLIGGAILSPFIWIHKRRAGALPPFRSLLRTAILGLLGFTVPVTLETIGIHRSSPALGAVSIALEPLFTLLVAALLYRTKLGPVRWFAMGIAAVGAWVIAGCPRPGFVGYLLGDVLMLIAVLCYAVYNAVSGRLTADVPPTVATSVMLLTSGIGCIPLFWLTGHHFPRHLSTPAVVSALFLCVLATAGAYLVWVIVLQDHDVSSAAITLYLQPIFGVLLSIAIVHVRPEWYFYVGSVLIFGALFLGRNRAVQSRAANAPDIGGITNE